MNMDRIDREQAESIWDMTYNYVFHKLDGILSLNTEQASIVAAAAADAARKQYLSSVSE